MNTALIGTADVEPSITYTPQSPSLTTLKADGITGTNTGIYYANGIITYKLTTIYNYSYYPEHIERNGYVKDIDWNEYLITVPDVFS